MTKKIMNKKNKVILIFSLLGLVLFLSFFLEPKTPSVIGEKLFISKDANLPLREISGASLFYDKSKNKKYIYTVGDASSEIFISEVDTAQKKLTNSYSIDIEKKITDKFAFCSDKKITACKKMLNDMTKQWEAIYVDPLKRIFLLNEPLATILVYDQKKQDITHRINLNNFSLEKKLGKFSKDPNSQGEGLLPLRNGHILVIKESKPSLIIEFGLATEKAQGFSKNLLVDEKNNFTLTEEKIQMIPLAFWKLPKEFSSCDLSELNYSREGKLEILSQRCQALIKIKDLEVEKKIVTIEKIWNLPRALKYAEAFISLEKTGDFIVFEDKKNIFEKNSYFLSQSSP